jgi:hypothetical protein
MKMHIHLSHSSCMEVAALKGAMRDVRDFARRIIAGSRPAQKIGKPFDVANIVELSLGAKPPDRHVLDQSPA